MKSSFDKFLKNNLSWDDYDRLDKLLGLSAIACTKLLRNPERGTIPQLNILEGLLQKKNQSLNADYLIKKFRFGSNPVVIIKRKSSRGSSVVSAG